MDGRDGGVEGRAPRRLHLGQEVVDAAARLQLGGVLAQVTDVVELGAAQGSVDDVPGDPALEVGVQEPAEVAAAGVAGQGGEEETARAVLASESTRISNDVKTHVILNWPYLTFFGFGGIAGCTTEKHVDAKTWPSMSCQWRRLTKSLVDTTPPAGSAHTW